MKWNIDASSLPSYFRVTETGNTTVSGYVEMWKELFSHPQWEPGSRVLVDVRHRVLDSKTAFALRDELLSLITKERLNVDGSCFAVITTQDLTLPRRSLEYGLKLRGLESTFRYFSTESAAKEWLLEMSHCSDNQKPLAVVT